MERWRIVAGHVPGPLALGLLGVCVVLALAEAVLAYRRARAVPRRLRMGLLALRVLGVLALLVVGLELGLSQETVRPTGPRVAILVDRSASMALADADEPGAPTTARLDRLRNFWAASAPARAAWREQGLAISPRAFATRSEPLADAAAARTAAALANGHALPPPDPADFGIGGADRDWLARRQVPHPFGPYRDPLHFNGDRWGQLPRSFIDCVQPAYASIAAMRERVRAMPGLKVIEMQTGHCPMVTEPQLLVQHLLALAAAPD